MKKNKQFLNYIAVCTTILSTIISGCTSKSVPAQVEDRRNMVFGRNGPMELVRIYPGDTVESISQQHNVPVEVITSSNHLSYPYHLHSVRSLLIPKGKYHKVVKGETLKSIAEKYDVDVIQLMDVNNMMHQPITQRIKDGAVLTIPEQNIGSVEQHTMPSGGYKPTKNYDLMELEEVPEQNVSSSNTKEGTFEVDDEDDISTPSKQDRENLPKKQEEFDFENDLRKTLDKDANNDDTAAISPAVIKSEENDTFATVTPLNLPQFIWPLSGKIIRDKKHEGITIAAPLNSPIKAAGSGKVIFAANDNGEYGNLIIIKHSDGYLTAYAHNNQLLVKKGDEVNKGQSIARVGKSGKAKTPQLYFSVRKGKEIVDPESDR